MNNDIKRIKNKIKDFGITANDVIPISDIRDFERSNQISLPEELIGFYSEIGNGCTMIDGFLLKSLEELLFDKRAAEEFIFTEYWIWEAEEEDNYELLSAVEKGHIELINIGDSQSWNIIVSGKEKGQMWFFSDVGIQPCCPKRSFLSWFEYWLDGNEDYFKDFVYIANG